jgi:Transposase domain (DUF772)
VHSEWAPYYYRLGRPSIDPVLMIRMLVVGYVFAIRSERALCRDVGVNLAYRWFCGLSIGDKIPDHSPSSSSHWQQSRKTSADWQSSSSDRRRSARRALHKGAQFGSSGVKGVISRRLNQEVRASPPRPIISDFYKKSALSGHDDRAQRCPLLGVKRTLVD